MLTLLLVVVSFQGDSTPTPTVSLAEAIRQSYRVAPTAVAARGLVGTAASQRRASWAGLLTPVLSVGGDWNSVTPQVFNFNVLQPTGAALGALPLTFHTTDANITASYTLFNGGQNFSRVRAARFSEASAVANEDAVRADTRVGTETAYYTVDADQELLRVAFERVHTVTQELAVARARVAAGAAVETDSLQLVLELTAARISL